MMNEGYAWGGPDDSYYYKIDTGEVIGGIRRTKEGIYEAGLDWRRKWTYIDADTARKAVEETQRIEIKRFEFMIKKTPEEVSKLLEEPVPVKNTKKFWEIWK